MTEYLTEQEQIQQLKDWLKQYGLTIIAGILLALFMTSVWHYWQAYRNKILVRASLLFDEMITFRAEGKVADEEARAKKLLTNYANTPYAQMAAFMLGREAILKKSYPEAITKINWVIDHSKDKTMRQIARIRIARIYNAENNMQDALNFLKKVDDKTFMGLIDEVRGDAYLGLKDIPNAKKFYQQALHELPNGEVTRPILQMKLDNLAGRGD